MLNQFDNGTFPLFVYIVHTEHFIVELGSLNFEILLLQGLIEMYMKCVCVFKTGIIF